MNTSKIKIQLQQAQNSWKELIKKGNEIREQELLDHYEIEIGNEIIKEKALQKKIIECVKKQKMKNHQFQYLTKHVGRGPNHSLKRLHIKDKNSVITETFLDQTTIERKIIDHNRQHYKKVMNMNAYNDKIYDMLQNNTIQNKILSRNL